MTHAESRMVFFSAVRLAMLSVLFVVPAHAYETKVFELPLDTAVATASPAPDGKVWFVGRKPGALGILDPSTGEVRFIPLGKNSAPRSVMADKDGNAWIADSGQNAMVRVNVNTDEVKVWPVPQDLGYANLNTFVFDHDRMLWFTGTGPNGPSDGEKGVYGRLDVATGDIKVWRPPQGRGASGMTVTPDGEVWYVSVAPSYIAHIDRATGNSHVVKTPHPNAEPHGVWSDSKGNLWVDEWNTGYLDRYTPKTGKWKSWLVPGDKPPHLVGVFVDDKDIVWVVQRTANATYAFDSATEKFIAAIPGSKPEAGVRQILGRPGEVWLPEGGTGRIMLVKTGAVKAAVR